MSNATQRRAIAAHSATHAEESSVVHDAWCDVIDCVWHRDGSRFMAMLEAREHTAETGHVTHVRFTSITDIERARDV